MSGMSRGKGELISRQENSMVRGMEERLWVELGDTLKLEPKQAV